MDRNDVNVNANEDGNGDGDGGIDYQKAYGELEIKLGEQGKELGDTRKMNEMLMGKLDGQAQEAPKDEPETDYDKEISSIAEQVRTGDLSIDEALMQTSSLTAELASNKTMDRIAKDQEKQTLTTSQNQFYKDNPDFKELQKNGTLKAVGKTLPGLHDDFSAYYAHKANQNSQAVEAARLEGIDAGKAEAAKIADGDKNTRKVISKPGSGSEQDIGEGSQNTGQPLSKSQMRQSMLQAVQSAKVG
jgi:hypothetical protein